MKGSTNLKARWWSPFVITGMLWFVFGSIACSGFLLGGADPAKTVKWFAVLWFFCVLDLFLLGKALSSAVALMSLKSAEQRIPLSIQTSFWGTLKLACLGFMSLLLYQAKGIPFWSLFFGIGTMILVPLFGGYWWSHLELRKETRRYA